jgi:IclR family transcriptional regulator, pca regulon regulatory protein
MQNSINKRYFINSLARGFKLLEKMAEAEHPLTLSQVAESMAMTLPTAYRFLYTLQAIDFIEKEPDRKAYRITPKVLKLGYGVFKSSELWNTAHPYLLRASQEYGETFNLAVLEKDRILYIDRVKTQSILTINLEIGSKLPAYCTSMGRVLLAWLPLEEARRRLRLNPRKKYTDRTVTGLAKLEKILAHVRRSGYAVNNGELAPELASVAAPVFNRQGKVVAALNMAANAARHGTDYLHQVMVPAVVQCAERISSAMGHFKDENSPANEDAGGLPDGEDKAF